MRLAQELVRIPSVTGDETAVQDRVAAAMDEAGLAVDRFEAELPRLRNHPRFPGTEVERDKASLVAGVLGSKGDRALILNGHVDVVPPGDRQRWRASPWSGHVEAGRLYGRGACDMKAGVAVMIAVAGALARSRLPLRGRLILESVVSEEDGGLGTFAMIDRGFRADAAVILEPTRLRPIAAQAGALTFKLRVQGRAAHASVRYEGVSALEKFALVEARLRQLERELNAQSHPAFREYAVPYALSIGKLRAGAWAATVPETLEAEGRVGVPVGMASSAVRRRLESAVADAARQDAWMSEHPPQVEWSGGQFDAAEADLEHPAFLALRQAQREELGVEPQPTGAPYGSDMRLFVHEAEMPALLYGPGDIRQAHATDEWVAVDEVLRAARVLTLWAATYLGADPGA